MDRLIASLKRWPTLALVIGGAFLAGCQDSSEQQQQGAAPPPPAVEFVTLQTESVNISETYSGRVTAYRSAEIRPQVSGIILERAFEEGARVEAGDLLYQIDPAVYEAELAAARSELALARANAESARLLAERYASLVKTSAVSQQEADDASAAWKQAQAQIQAAEAAVKRAQIDLDYTRITAPIAGIISRSNVTEGALVSAQQSTALARVHQLSPVYVDIRQPASALLKLKRDSGVPETSIQVSLDDGTTYPETGTLKFAESQVDQDTGTVNIRALFNNSDEWLLPGMFVRASVVIEQLDNAILAPQPGIIRQPNGAASAMVITEEDKVESRPVSVGRAIGNKWLVNDGLQAGDRIIVKGLQKVSPGAQVTPQPAQGDSESR
ncbi:MAG: MexE family multidrug efflux RND transporter periplasmic adaptor subunit [Oceanospirillaceae bacterium]|jgi:membrane fusion protein (multidrug efflux system)|uniref:efflux RND transporter periplasmic adaptor subunit n=1 Tax=Marinobacterium litorale TaxID=404770 RepID=UPI00040AA5D4|nr:efflux RND transporter periplasmic adaptor subunit [Marinobacterium litorale]MBT00452.1 MexE family multidrug efflux RND transporter periplasmic adaptor subunit [Oceanospirillaceae bacterium]